MPTEDFVVEVISTDGQKSTLKLFRAKTAQNAAVSAAIPVGIRDGVDFKNNI